MTTTKLAFFFFSPLFIGEAFTGGSNTFFFASPQSSDEEMIQYIFKGRQGKVSNMFKVHRAGSRVSSESGLSRSIPHSLSTAVVFLEDEGCSSRLSASWSDG